MRLPPVVRKLDFEKASLVVAPPDVIPEEEIYCHNEVSPVNNGAGQGYKEEILVADNKTDEEVVACTYTYIKMLLF